MAPYLRPSTLFSNKFESYLNQYNPSKHKEDPVVSKPFDKDSLAKDESGNLLTF